ncbi:MAG TPA: helix-hairpin-helix domain-containing protein [Anaerolineae bacterium]|nr:helix-hairpin-helix domain-containing protein [Anaerolineae bacterium]
MIRKVAILFVLLFFTVTITAFAAPVMQAEEEGNPWWLWLIVFAVIALFVGFMLWWWLREPEEEEEPAATRHRPAGVYDTHDMPEAVTDGQVVAAETSPTETAESIASVPETADFEVVTPPAEPETAVRDDLTIIEGIGPAIQKVLYGAGIHTFHDLAAADPDRLEAILQEADRNLARLFDPTTWPEQARLAADARWEELKALKDRLTAGRRG